MASALRKTGHTTQTADRPQRQALRWLIVQAATYRKVEGHGSNTFDVFIPGLTGGPETYLGRVGESSYGDMGTGQEMGLKWDHKFADDVLARLPWQGGSPSINTKEQAAYFLLPDTI